MKRWEEMTVSERIQSVPEYYRPLPGTSGELSFLTMKELAIVNLVLFGILATGILTVYLKLA